MNKLLIILAVAFLIVLGVLQLPRLKAYDECYMAKYEDWSTDCVLTMKGGE